MKRRTITITIFVVSLIVVSSYFVKNNRYKQVDDNYNKKILLNYSQYVRAKNNSKIYSLINNMFEESGIINNKYILKLGEIKNEYYDECKKLENMEQNNKKDNSNNDNELMQKMANQTKIMENKFNVRIIFYILVLFKCLNFI